jgi:transcriptional regulator with XRE-family HTH domain
MLVPVEPETVGTLLIRARAERSLSQRALARRLGVPQPTVAMVETGVRPLPTDWGVVEATAEVLGMHPRTLHARLLAERGRAPRKIG